MPACPDKPTAVGRWLSHGRLSGPECVRRRLAPCGVVPARTEVMTGFTRVSSVASSIIVIYQYRNYSINQIHLYYKHNSLQIGMIKGVCHGVTTTRALIRHDIVIKLRYIIFAYHQLTETTHLEMINIKLSCFINYQYDFLCYLPATPPPQNCNVRRSLIVNA